MNRDAKNILVLGSGELARHFVEVAKPQGHALTVTTTTPDKIDALSNEWEVEALQVEGCDTDAVAAAMRGKDVVVVAVAPKKERLKGLTFDDPFYQVLDEAYKHTARNVARARSSSDPAPKVVYISAHTVYPDADGATVDENTYALPRHRMASIIREAELTALDWIPGCAALRLGWLLSPRRHWGKTLPMFQRYELPGHGRIKANMVHVEDAARAALFAVERDLRGIYNVCNDAHPLWRELWEGVCADLALPAPRWNEALRDEWFEGDHEVCSQKIKDAGFEFLHPLEDGRSFAGRGALAGQPNGVKP